MKKRISILLSVVFVSCFTKKQPKLLAELPKKLNEVSGITKVKGSDLLWVHNDGENKNEIYGLTPKGKIKKTVVIKGKNNDWEDITSDDEGNLYIADFGNNDNIRKNLVVLKITNNDLLTKNEVEVEKIKFSYPDQHNFPPKKEKRFFDAEGIFYLNNNLYIFTKSRVEGLYGKTNIYKIPAERGTYVAEFISDFTSCKERSCWITSAAISPNKKTVALLNLHSLLLFKNFTHDNFFKGTVTEIPLGFISQKEGIAFKNNNTIYITDEKSEGKGGNLYVYKF